VVIDRLKQR